MTSLILSPLKVVLRSTPAEWLGANERQAVLVTGSDAEHSQEWLEKHYGDSFREIVSFPGYASNDLVLKRADELFGRYDFEHVVPMSEVDVVRAAVLRQRHGLPGLQPEDAVYLRDKQRMKERAVEHGVPVARFRRIVNALDLVDFVAEVGYPVVVKPLDGRGSAHTFVIATEEELDEHLAAGVISATDRLPDLLAEEFVHGPQYRVDGFYSGGVCRFISAGRFVGTHLEFLGGGYLINALLDAKSDLAKELVAFTRNVLENALPLGTDGMFHVEVFRRPSGQLVLGEAAARLGGASVFEENRTSFGVDFKMAGVRAFCGFEPPDWPPAEELQIRQAGHVLISPKRGMLVKAPDSLPFDWVTSYLNPVVGKRYQSMAYTNAEIATIMVVGDSDEEVEQRLVKAAEWFYDNSEWSDS